MRVFLAGLGLALAGCVSAAKSNLVDHFPPISEICKGKESSCNQVATKADWPQVSFEKGLSFQEGPIGFTVPQTGSLKGLKRGFDLLGFSYELNGKPASLAVSFEDLRKPLKLEPQPFVNSKPGHTPLTDQFFVGYTKTLADVNQEPKDELGKVAWRAGFFSKVSGLGGEQWRYYEKGKFKVYQFTLSDRIQLKISHADIPDSVLAVITSDKSLIAPLLSSLKFYKD